MKKQCKIFINESFFFQTMTRWPIDKQETMTWGYTATLCLQLETSSDDKVNWKKSKWTCRFSDNFVCGFYERILVREDQWSSYRIKMELKVWVEGIQRIVCGVTEKTTCQVGARVHVQTNSILEELHLKSFSKSINFFSFSFLTLSGMGDFPDP